MFDWIGRIFGAKPRRTLKDDIPETADWIAKALTSSGYRADFSPGSIAEVERFFAEHSTDGAPRPGGLLGDGLGQKLFALGSYCGEVLRREHGGEWQTDDNDPRGEVDAALKFPDGSICWPMQRMVKRLQGDDANVAHWAAFLRGQGDAVDIAGAAPP